jgi:hypothetical protein
MIGNLMQKGAWRLPAIRPVAQPIANTLQLARMRPRQALLGSVAGVAVIAAAFAGFGYVRHARGVAEAQLAASRVETANIDLQDELARLRDQIAASNRDLAAAQSRVVALTEEMQASPRRSSRRRRPPKIATSLRSSPSSFTLPRHSVPP